MSLSSKSFDSTEISDTSTSQNNNVGATNEEFSQVANISEQFQNDTIFNSRELNLISSTLLENKLRVFSYNQRKTEYLPLVLDSNIYNKLINNDYEDSRSILQNFIVFSDKLSLLNEISENSVAFRNSIEDISKAAEVNSKNFETLNFSNIVFDFLNTGSSRSIGKIFKRANDDFRNIVLNNTKKYEDIKLLEDQDSVYQIENSELISNTDFQKKFMQLNTRPGALQSGNLNNRFIYNTDKLISQIHINYMQSEKFLSPNTFNSVNVENNSILFIEDYPILEIGSRLTNNINFNEYYTRKGNVKNNLIRKDAKNNTLSIIDTSNIYSRNSLETCKFISYSNNLYRAYYPELSTYRLEGFGEIDFLTETYDNNRIFDESLSNTLFLTDCRIKYGSTFNVQNEEIARDITSITAIDRIPLSYFRTLGNYFKNSEIEDDLSYNLSYLTFHNPSSDYETIESSDLYLSTRKIPFTFRKKEEFDTEVIDNLEQVYENISDQIKDLFEISIAKYSNMFSDDDILDISRTKDTHNISKGELIFNKYSNINTQTISSLSYLENILVLFEKVDRVIDTFSIGESSESYRSFVNKESSIPYSSRKNSISRAIKAKIETISRAAGKAIRKINTLFSRLKNLNYLNITSEDLSIIVEELSKIELYFEKLNSLLKRMLERFIKLEIDESTGNYILEDGDFKLKYIVEYFDILEGSINKYHFAQPQNFSASPQDFLNFLREKRLTGINTFTDANRITSDDIYEEGGTYTYTFFGDINNRSNGALSCREQFMWSLNTYNDLNNYPRIYDYINNSLYSLLYGSRSNTSHYAGQFRDIPAIESANIITVELIKRDGQIDRFNYILDRIQSSDYIGHYNNTAKPANSILDVHAFNYGGSINKRVNSYLRSNYIEPCQNTLSDITKIDFITSLNNIKKTKLDKEGIKIEEVLPFASKLRERSIGLQKEGKEIVFAYGNKESENILLTLNDSEIKTLIQEETFTNNYRKDILIDDSRIKTTSNLVSEGINLEGDFEGIKEKILKISSLYYGNNTFKNNKTLLFRILQKINTYVNSHSSNWNREVNQQSYIRGNRIEAEYDYHNKDYFCNFQYDSFISKLFDSDISYDESKDFIKRLVAYSICKQTPFENKVTSLSEINISNDENSKDVFSENISEILKIDKLNNNSKEINNFIYSDKTLESVLKYTVLDFKNPRESYDDSGYFGIFEEGFQNTLYPLNIWSYKNFSQNKITFVTSGFDYSYDSKNFFENFLEDESFLYKENILSQEEYKIELSNRLNVPNKNEVNILKNISIKKIFDQEDDELISKVRASSVLEEDKTSDLVYKFRTAVKEKFWLSKSFTKSLEEESTGYYEEREKNPTEEPVSISNISDYNYDIPGLDMFYYAINNGEKSIFYLFNDILTELLEYYNVDFEQFEDYDSILSFVDGENKILNSVFDLLRIYCSMFKIVFDRYQSYFIYNLCFSLTKENYTDSEGVVYYIDNNFVKLQNIQINNVIETFKMLPNLTKDLTRIYDYFIDDSNNTSNLENNFNSVSKDMEGLNVSLQDIGFESKDTFILLDLINTCNINDITKSLSLDILCGYYRTLSNTNNITQEISRETDLRLSNLRKYFLSDNYSFETCLNNQFYLNMVSKKIQNYIYRNVLLHQNFIDSEKDIEDNAYFDDLFYSLKDEKLNDIRMLKHLYDKINNTPYIEENSSTETSDKLLVNQTFDFIKIGFEYDAISNFSEGSLFKIDIYSFDHNTFDIEYLDRDNIAREKVKTFYYTPSLTSVPSSFFNEISSDESGHKYVGFYNKTGTIKNRFTLLNKEEVINNIRKIINTSGTSDFIMLDTDEYRFIDSDEDQQSYTGKLGSKIFSDQYVSMFCEYYEKLINNITSENFFESDDNLADKVILENFYNEMLSINASNFINTFEISKDDFVLGTKGNNFRLLAPKISEIQSKNKSSSFMENLSKVKTDVDVYKIMHVNKYYDFFNIMIKAPEDKNVTYALKVEVL